MDVKHYLSIPFFLLPLPALAVGESSDCVEQVRLHGLLTTAMPVCEFRHYAKMFQYKAESCQEILGEQKHRRTLAEGKQAFDARRKEMGRERLCSKLRSDFPWTVR
jgi:hypothetical protein